MKFSTEAPHIALLTYSWVWV